MKTEVVKKSLKFKKTKIVLAALLGFGAYCAICVYSTKVLNLASSYMSVKYVEAKTTLAERFDLIRYETHIVEPTEAETEELVSAYSEEFGMDSIVPLALMDKESKNNPGRWRYEPGWRKDYGCEGRDTKCIQAHPERVVCPAGYNEEECELLFSSIGLMQVSFPIWKDLCEVTSPYQLFDRATNIKCAIKVMSKCIYENMNITDNSTLLRYCFKRYNGNGPRAEAYATDRMANIAGYAIANRKLLAQKMKQTLKKDNEIEANLDISVPAEERASIVRVVGKDIRRTMQEEG